MRLKEKSRKQLKGSLSLRLSRQKQQLLTVPARAARFTGPPNGRRLSAARFEFETRAGGIMCRWWCRAEKECKALESELRTQRDLAILGMHGRAPAAAKVIVRPASAAAVVNSKSTARSSSDFFGESNWK